MKILLIGKTGQLGSSLLQVNTSHEIYAPNRHDLDIESIKSVKVAIERFKPDIVINTAAFHNVPQCEVEPLRAFQVNCVAASNLANCCREFDIKLVTFSTDYVFGGEKRTPYGEEDRPNPLQMYGISRLAGEHAVMSSAPEHSVIIRTSGLYGFMGATSKGGSFVDKRIADAKVNLRIEMGCDQVVSPTYTHDLAIAVLKLIGHRNCNSGIYHLVNQGECTWFEFTVAIYRFMGLSTEVVPVDRHGVSDGMRRPLYSAMMSIKAHSLDIEMPDWQNALKRYLTEKYVF